MLSWNEIRSRATAFANEWSDETRERSESQSFWNEFFIIFDVRRRSVARYEEYTERLSGGQGFIDLFWPGVLIAEHKSAGEDLEAAYEQALDYFDALSEKEKPRYILICDFENVHLYDYEGESGVVETKFKLKELPKHIQSFGFIAGYEKKEYREEDPINVKAVAAIGNLYEQLQGNNYPTNDSVVFLTRIVFCLFADDTGIFSPDTLKFYIEDRTNVDGSDLGYHINTIFEILNTPLSSRQNNIDESLVSLPYVNGGLFSERITPLAASSELRRELLRVMKFDWSEISPAIFGSMFQSVMDEEARHNLGAHYTSEKNIQKVIGPLFLDSLKTDLENAKSNHEKLNKLWDKITNIKLLDPACGCGNFLVVAYRELRSIELEIIKRLNPQVQAVDVVNQANLSLDFDVEDISRLSVENLYGIEIDYFASEIAKLSLWLIDHVANVELGAYFGKFYSKLPLTEAPHIVNADALEIDWNKVVDKNGLSYILGNPPFYGSKVMSQDQRDQVVKIYNEKTGGGILDFVAAWYLLAAEYIQDTNIKCAFVSTNSITQGEQVGRLWNKMIDKYRIYINYGHRTFKWQNEAPGKAAVYCVIVGFSLDNNEDKLIFDYENPSADPIRHEVKNINPYLVDAPNIVITSRRQPLCEIPEIGIGNKPIDGGYYIFTDEEKREFLKIEPEAKNLFREYLGAREFLNGDRRWILWLGETSPSVLKSLPNVLDRINKVKKYRHASKSKLTNELAQKPTRFHVENIPTYTYVVIPETSSERRYYIPIGFVGKNVVTSNSMKIVPNATLYHFGVLESMMHMAWMRAVCGRFESRYRYSKDIVYNNFPWPDNPSSEKVEKIEKAAGDILTIRAKYHDSTLADLYDPLTMPADLLKAHQKLDKAVDNCYNARMKFATEADRLEYLFEKYEELVQKHNKNI